MRTKCFDSEYRDEFCTKMTAQLDECSEEQRGYRLHLKHLELGIVHVTGVDDVQGLETAPVQSCPFCHEGFAPLRDDPIVLDVLEGTLQGRLGDAS